MLAPPIIMILSVIGLVGFIVSLELNSPKSSIIFLIFHAVLVVSMIVLLLTNS